MTKKERLKIIAIVGQTASGKSTLAVHLAKKLGGEIVSADSRQVYRGLNIGTGKMTKKEMQGVPHHLLDVVSPRRTYTAAQFKRDAERAIQSIVQKEKTPIVVGGTGFYFDVLFGAVVLASVPPNDALRKKLETKTTPQLGAMLQKLDKDRAATIDLHNRHRLVRAIEIAKNKSQISCANHPGKLKYEVLWIGIKHPREILHERINERLLTRLRQGMVAEAKKLHAQGLSYKRMRELGLEYRYLADYLQNKLSREQLIKTLETKIWQYAKRQETWFKRNKMIRWFAPNETRKIEQAVDRLLQP